MIENMNNEFVPIKDFPNYKINGKGIILNPYNKELAINIRSKKDKSSYYSVNLHKDGIQHTLSIHRLLALQFIENPENKPLVDHIDRNKLNNDLSNLRWATHSENTQNSDRCESQISYSKEYKAEWMSNKRASLTEEEKVEHLEHRRELYSKKEQTEEQKEKARERAKKQREAIKADPEKYKQLQEYKKQKAEKYKNKKN